MENAKLFRATLKQSCSLQASSFFVFFGGEGKYYFPFSPPPKKRDGVQATRNRADLTVFHSRLECPLPTSFACNLFNTKTSSPPLCKTLQSTLVSLSPLMINITHDPILTSRSESSSPNICEFAAYSNGVPADSHITFYTNWSDNLRGIPHLNSCACSTKRRSSCTFSHMVPT